MGKMFRPSQARVARPPFFFRVGDGKKRFWYNDSLDFHQFSVSVVWHFLEAWRTPPRLWKPLPKQAEQVGVPSSPSVNFGAKYRSVQ